MNLIEKIKKLLKRLKGKKEILLEESKKDKDISQNRKADFIKNVDAREQKEMFDLQKKYEEGEISPYELSIYQVMGLTDLYKEQIEELNRLLEKYNNS